MSDIFGMKRSKSRKKEEEAILHSNEVSLGTQKMLRCLISLLFADNQPAPVLLLRSGHPEAPRKVRKDEFTK